MDICGCIGYLDLKQFSKHQNNTQIHKMVLKKGFTENRKTDIRHKRSMLIVIGVINAKVGNENHVHRRIRENCYRGNHNENGECRYNLSDMHELVMRETLL